MTRQFLVLALALPLCAQPEWKFAVSGDSRNCGDLVMPAIAAGVRHDGEAFYWHLGDFRAIYTFDEDLEKPLNIITYETTAWPDFIAHQLAAFGSLPVFLGIGNHETIPPATREKYLIQFADWLTAPAIRGQRLADDPADHAIHTYYHWVERNIDFISLDNASNDQFDDTQLKWFHSVLRRDEANPAIRGIVVGMHAALPGSFGGSHSMDDWAQGRTSGREVYEALWHAQSAAGKHVYILASHSHFYFPDVYRTPSWKDKVIPGWIIGTAGAVRYPLPAGAPANAMTGVYGYLVAAAHADGAIDFEFQKIAFDDLKRANPKRPESLLRWCMDENKQ
ncbi:MAG TPA: hypothetical protein VMB03_19735 [Bryobacteraceae bacterium]|nr:hypothetical protein [Bryobacteraceae bacterium]